LNDTIANNAAYFGGGIAYPDEADTIENTIVADNSGGVTSGGGGDCYDSSTTDNAGSADVGGNIDGDSTCFISTVIYDLVGVNPLLAPLALNVASGIETDALIAKSPAIGNGVTSPLACPQWIKWAIYEARRVTVVHTKLSLPRRGIIEFLDGSHQCSGSNERHRTSVDIWHADVGDRVGHDLVDGLGDFRRGE